MRPKVPVNLFFMYGFEKKKIAKLPYYLKVKGKIDN